MCGNAEVGVIMMCSLITGIFYFFFNGGAFYLKLSSLTET